jgi:lipopolysaccharide transport system permease protein
MKQIIELLNYCFKTRRAWWYTALSKTKARYARTKLGSLWLGFSSLFTVLCLGFIYGKVFRVENFFEYFIYLGFGLLIWNSICDSINSAPLIFSRNSSSIKNSKLRPIFFICQEWAFQMQNFLQAFLMVAGMFFIISPVLFINMISAPIHLINFALFTFWLPLIVSILGIKFTDLFQLLPVITNLIFLLSPILYNQKNLGKLGIIADFNPVYQILKLLRDSIIYGNNNFLLGIIVFLINLFMLFITLKIYLKLKNKIVYYL